MSGCDRGPGDLRDFRDRLPHLFWFVIQRQISLRDNSNDTVLCIHNRYSSYLVLLHQSLTNLDIFAIAACERSQGNEFSDRRGLWIHALPNDGAAQIAI